MADELSNTAETLPVAPMMEEKKPTGFDAWFAHKMGPTKGLVTDKAGKRFKGGAYAGKTPEEAFQLAQAEYAGLADEEKATWDARAAGAHLQPGSGVTGPGMPFSPPSAAARYSAMNQQAAGRDAMAKQAVADKIKQQRANPGAVADSIIAASDNQLAKSGVTDMGGGVRAMTNKRGTGFAQPMTPQEAADRRAGKTQGTIIDERGVVDMNKLRAGQLGYMPGTENSALTLDAGDAIKQQIQSNIAAAAPGMAGRRAEDKASIVAGLSPMPTAVPQVAAAPKAPTKPTAKQGEIAPVFPFPGASAPKTPSGIAMDPPVASAYAQRFYSPETKAAMEADQAALLVKNPKRSRVRVAPPIPPIPAQS